MSQTKAEAPARAAARRTSAKRFRFGEYSLIGVVLLYAGGLLVAPLVAILWGALGDGVSAFVKELTSADALSSLKLTMVLAVAATVINTVFGTCIAWVLVRDDFKGKAI